MKRATRSFSSRISAGSSGTITGAPSLSEDLSRRERAFEYRLLERAWRAAVACLTDREAVLGELRRHRLLGLPAQRKHDLIGVHDLDQLRSEDVAQPDRVAG